MLVFAAAIFLSAFLLFQVQPLVGKLLLPEFGGSSSVWMTCLFFFQGTLLLGYAYSHWLTSTLRPGRQALAHLGLLAATLLFLPMSPPHANAFVQLSPSVQILLLLILSVGLPFFVLSTTAPLLQRWFSSLSLSSPYPLYAISNLGAVLALVGYPFVVEPYLSLDLQISLWSVGLACFLLLCALTSLLFLRNAPRGASTQNRIERPGSDVAPGERRFLWIALPAVASALLLATTNKMTLDVAPVPFLWIAPLFLYLLSFIVTFANVRWYSRTWFGLGFFICLLGAEILLRHFHDLSTLPQICGLSLVLLVTCVVCHGELARLTPPSALLTSFYLHLALGGTLGSVAVSILAPLLFQDYWELHLSMLIAAVLILYTWWRDPASRLHQGRRWAIWLSLLLILVGSGALFFQHTRSRSEHAIYMSRDFYGTLTVNEVDRGLALFHYYSLIHGEILHGLQLQSDTLREKATTYFGEESGAGRLLRSFPRQENRRIGVLGLGVGTLATYGRSGDTFRFYELNPEVVEVSRHYFSYLSDSEARIEVSVGDGRRRMEREEPQNFDLLFMDAFSSDAVPVHLLTQEACEVYLKHLKTDGVIAFNITNRYLDLEPVVRGLARTLNLQVAVIGHQPSSLHWWERYSRWILMGNQPLLDTLDESEATTPKSSILWTDDYAPLFQVVKW